MKKYIITEEQLLRLSSANDDVRFENSKLIIDRDGGLLSSGSVSIVNMEEYKEGAKSYTMEATLDANKLVDAFKHSQPMSNSVKKRFKELEDKIEEMKTSIWKASLGVPQDRYRKD